VGLVQINNSFSGQCYLPYSVGLLQAHLMAHLREPPQVKFLLPIYTRIKVEQAVEQLLEADVVLFSTYVWNLRLSLAIAERLKAAKPWSKIIFGGPQVPDSAPGFLTSNPFIDIVVHGEGEQVLLHLLENCRESNWNAAPGISFRDPAGRIIQNPKGPRISNLNEIASPYLSGIFEPLISARPDRSLGNKPRMSLLMYFLRLGFGDGDKSLPVQS
jgi:hypothetical protein